MRYWRVAGIAVLAAAMAVGGCQKKEDKDVIEPAVIRDVEKKGQDLWEAYSQALEENTNSEAFRNSLNDFAYKSAAMILKDRDVNKNYSPLSLYYALGMAGAGAGDGTSQELNAVLGVSDRAELAAECGKLYRSIYYMQKYNEAVRDEYDIGNKDEKMPEISLGNSMWADRAIKLKSEYQKLMTDEFYASIHRVSFEEDQTWKDMAAWIKEQTKGVLEPNLETNEDTVISLINTLYYYGGWKEPFSESDTAPGVFTTADGTEVMVDFMNKTSHIGGYRKGDGYQAAVLGTGERETMIFVLPDEGYTVDEWLESPEKLKEALGDSYETREIDWKMPKFSFGSSMDLADTLTQLGAAGMFGTQADFSAMTDNDVFVSRILQETHIGVDESGVEGAAYTMLLMEAGAAMMTPEKASMILDRPFLYGIYSDQAGWLFIGIVDNPA